MAISLFDALTIAPMLSAYLAGSNHKRSTTGIYGWTLGLVLDSFEKFQHWLDASYEKLLRWVLKHPFATLSMALVIFFASMFTGKYVTKTFLPTQDAGEFQVGFDLPPGTSLEAMSNLGLEVSNLISHNKEIDVRALTVGNSEGEVNSASIYVKLVPSKLRPGVNTSDVKERIRQQLKPYAYAHPAVKDYDAVGAGDRPFALNIYGQDQQKLETLALAIQKQIKDNPNLKDVDINFRPGKPEFRVVPDAGRAQLLGVTTAGIGQELRTMVEGVTPAKFRENGIEYDIRVRLQEDQRDLAKGFDQIYVPNLNNTLVRLRDVTRSANVTGPSKITRQDRNRYVQVNADIAPGGGLGDVINQITQTLQKDFNLKPQDFKFIGQAENFEELITNMIIAMGAGVLFIYFVLSSLYESFVTPFTIMLALPLAVCGSLLALFIANESLNIFSMIGIIMLLGVATKNSILLIDYAQQLTAQGLSRSEAIIRAGRTRLRPIIMTTMALIAGTIPIAIGLNEASKQRTSMGIAIIGGLISSTLLTLIVVPAAYSYIDRFKHWISGVLFDLFVADSEKASATKDRKIEVAYTASEKEVSGQP
jgi:HAE1 family hydrophobic/amphiphilic exporter-1